LKLQESKCAFKCHCASHLVKPLRKESHSINDMDQRFSDYTYVHLKFSVFTFEIRFRAQAHILIEIESVISESS